jgi:hypothetical protein
VLMHDLQSSLVGGTQNWALLSNPTNAPVEVQVRAFTALEGTAYTLAPFVIDPFSIYRFRGDGQGLKENPGAVGEPDVPFVRFLFSSNGAFGIRGIRQQFDPSGLLIFMSPHIIRHED